MILDLNKSNSLMRFMHKKVKSEIFKAIFLTFLARGLVTAGSLFLLIVLGNLFGPEGVGAYALSQSVIWAAAIVSRYGMNDAVMRFVSQDRDNIKSLVYLRWGTERALYLSTFSGCVIFFLSNIVASFFDSEGLKVLLVGVAFSVPAFTLSFIFSGFLKGVRKPASSILLENGSVALLTGLFTLAGGFFWPERGIEVVSWAFAISAWLVFLQGVYQVYSWKKAAIRSVDLVSTVSSKALFLESSSSFFVISLSRLMHLVVGVMIVGWLLNETDVGLFKAAQQAAALISFIFIVISAIFPPRFATLFHEKDKAGLYLLVKKSSVLGLVLAAPMFVVCFFFPHWVLSVIGGEFVEAELLLRVIAFGQIINVALGGMGPLLNMTGNEKVMRNISLTSNALGLLLFFLLIPLMGVVGAAVSLSFMLVFQGLLAFIYVKKLSIFA